MSDLPTTSITFVAQSGRLAAQAALLATSLRDRLGASACLVAAAANELPGQLVLLFDELAVEIQPVVTPIDGYPISNKLAALVRLTTERGLLLDTDIVCLSAFDPDFLPERCIAVKPADLYAVGLDRMLWSYIYDLFGMTPPGSIHTTVERMPVSPYYNSGVVLTGQPGRLGQLWLDTAGVLDADSRIPARRPWLDQIALPVAVARAGLRPLHLPEQWNFPLNARPLEDHVALCHYHDVAELGREPRLCAFVADLSQRYPRLSSILADDEGWLPLLRQPRQSAPLPRRTIPAKTTGALPAPRPQQVVITGLPRSGTSLVAARMAALADTVVINEPPEVLNVMKASQPGRQLRLYLRRMRAQIIEHGEIMNKVDEQGRMVEDTWQQDVRRRQQLNVSGPGFRLAVKNPLAFLLRLPVLAAQLSADMPLLVGVRHPFDTLASWRDSFSHLQCVDLARIPFCDDADDPYLSRWQRAKLDEIRGERDLVCRRARFWRMLAEMVLAQQRAVTVIRYEDFCDRPSAILSRALDIRVPAIESSAPRRNVLDAVEAQTIHNLVGDVASDLGYDTFADLPRYLDR